MAENEVRVTETQSWGSRLGDSIKGVLFGLALFIAGFPVLFWNEGRAVATAKALDEGEGACISVESNAKVDPEMEGKLVHMTGKADTKDILADDAFGVSVNAIALKRKTEMFQWVEHSSTKEKKNLGGSVTKETVYKYSQEWSETAIDSSSFNTPAGHENPGAIEFPSESKRAANVSFGAFRLNESQIGRIGSEQAYAFPTGFTCKISRVQMQGNAILVPNLATRSNEKNVRDVATQPRVGDMRVTFSVVLPHDISIVSKQKGDSFTGYLAKSKKKVDMLSDGTKEAAEMFEAARSANTFLTWLVRLGGFLLMFIGLSTALKPLSVLADVLPILGDIVGVGAGIAAGLVAFACAILTIGVAWLFYRPLVGVPLVVAGGALLVKSILKKKKAAAAAPASPTEQQG